MEKPSGSLISYMANKVKSQGGINLAQGIPAFDPPVELLQALEKIIYENVHQYAPGVGNFKLLEQLSQYYRLPNTQFLMVNGATEGISLLFTYLLRLLPNTFTTLAFDPVYESYKHLPRIFNLPFVAFPLIDNSTIDFNLLETTIVKQNVKIILVASPGNPFGKIWSKQELMDLIELSNKHQFYIIFDAVYSDLYFDQPPYFPTDILTPNLFYVNAFSKKLSITGWRVGYIISHAEHMKALMDVHDYIGLCAPSILQTALANYLEKNSFGAKYTASIRERLKQNYKMLSSELADMGFIIYKAEGGYFVWCKLPNKFSSGLEFALDLYEKEKVAIVPGIHFSANGDRIVRINIARKPDEILEGMRRIKRYINNS